MSSCFLILKSLILPQQSLLNVDLVMFYWLKQEKSRFLVRDFLICLYFYATFYLSNSLNCQNQ